MAYRFPGMDPYLEAPTIWRGFHHGLAEEIRARLNPTIGPKYYADVEIHTTFEEVHVGKIKPIIPDIGIVLQRPRTPLLQTAGGMAVAPAATAPDVTVEQTAPIAPLRRPVKINPVNLRAVHIYTTANDELITSIELLSPYNKRGEGLAEYQRKRSRLLASNVHLVEIDLLRDGQYVRQRVGSEIEGKPFDQADYILLVHRGFGVNSGLYSDIWPVTLDKPLPLLPIPLEPPDEDVFLDLNATLHAIYARAAYERRIDYRQPVPPPALRPAMKRWLKAYFAQGDSKTVGQ